MRAAGSAAKVRVRVVITVHGAKNSLAHAQVKDQRIRVGTRITLAHAADYRTAIKQQMALYLTERSLVSVHEIRAYIRAASSFCSDFCANIYKYSYRHYCFIS